MSSQIHFPGSDATVSVSIINAGTLSNVPAALVLKLILPGYETWSAPMYSFLVEHKNTGKKLLFDLGGRKDLQSLAPAVLDSLRTVFGSVEELPFTMDVPKDVPEQLVKNGMALDEIRTVIWSHSHIDHIGDMSKFPSTTELLVGAGTDLRTYPTFEDAQLVESDISGRKINIVSFANSDIRIADLFAIDHFGDGSFYLLDTPGHLPGPISALAWISPTKFLLIGGDCCHHVGAMRPTPLHYKNFPPPPHVHGFCSLTAPILSLPTQVPSVYTDIPEAQDTLTKIIALDALPDVLTVISHDSSAQGAMPLFPTRIDGRKEGLLKKSLMWRFLERDSWAYRFGELNP